MGIRILHESELRGAAGLAPKYRELGIRELHESELRDAAGLAPNYRGFGIRKLHESELRDAAGLAPNHRGFGIRILHESEFRGAAGLAPKYRGLGIRKLHESELRDAAGLAPKYRGFIFAYCTSLSSVTLPDSLQTIGDWAFANCTSLSSVTLPNHSLTGIGEGIFESCEKLATINWPSSAEFTHFPAGLFDSCGLSSLRLPDSVTSIGDWAFTYCTSLSSVTLPDSLQSIGDYAYSMVAMPLRSIELPASVNEIGDRAFENCPAVPVFVGTGAAPAIMDNGSFDNHITVYYLNTRTGFTSTWYGNSTVVALDPAGYHALSSWLLGYGAAYDADPLADLNGDGVPLLLAYALNLDPTQDQSGSLPAGVVDAQNAQGASFYMDYYAAAEGIRYTVKSSDDLLSWESSAVSVEPVPGEPAMERASVQMDVGKRFLRLEVEQTSAP